MSTPERSLVLALALVLGACAATSPSPRASQSPGLGKPISERDIAAWDISAAPSGSGLPRGSGTPAQGAKLYKEKCVMCHGENGAGKPFAALVGGAPLTNGIDTTKTIANFWGYSTIFFDFTRRAMPFQAPRTLTNDEVYALTAYILSLNKLIGESDVMNAETLPKVKMPNRDGFVTKFPALMP